ncbi:hypothetical protein [Rhizobium laguerreae]|uniref:hypothetical protein n=1 Tax=Rhizobium laguerreae TaxID=1076926 RepID=UPI001C911EC8|nr:hypothetical protein [Rhizobium laguerreae]
MVKTGSHGIDAGIIIGAARFSWNRENSRGDITIPDSSDPPRLRDAGNAFCGMFRKFYKPARIFHYRGSQPQALPRFA